jgi:hypothetical protein
LAIRCFLLLPFFPDALFLFCLVYIYYSLEVDEAKKKH